jgi:hypothetical protein
MWLHHYREFYIHRFQVLREVALGVNCQEWCFAAERSRKGRFAHPRQLLIELSGRKWMIPIVRAPGESRANRK